MTLELLTWMVMRRSARASCGAPPACLEAARPSRIRAVRMRSSRRLMPDENVEAITPAAETYIETLRLTQRTRSQLEICWYSSLTSECHHFSPATPCHHC